MEASCAEIATESHQDVKSNTKEHQNNLLDENCMQKTMSQLQPNDVKESLLSAMAEAAFSIDSLLDAIQKDGECIDLMQALEVKVEKAIVDMNSEIDAAKEILMEIQVIKIFENSDAIIEVFCGFAKSVFAKLGTTGLSCRLTRSLLAMEQFFWDYCSESDCIRKMLSHNGMIVHFLYQLGELRKNSTSISELMLVSIGVLYCFEEYHKQFQDIEYYLTFVPYIHSSIVWLRTSSLFSFSYFRIFLHEEEMELLSLEKEEVDEITTIFGKPQCPDEIKFAGLVFSVTEFLEILGNLVCLPKNSKLFVHCGLIDLLGKLLVIKSERIRLLSLVLLWNVCADCNDLMETLISHFNPCSLEETQVMAAIEFGIKPNLCQFNAVNAIKACYKHQKYSMCTKIFDQFLTLNSNCSLDKVNLLHAKSLYHLFMKEQTRLKYFVPDVKLYKMHHDMCYSKAKQAILLLGNALDNGYIDDEGGKFLDFSMIE